MDFYLTLLAYLIQSKENWDKYNEFINWEFLKGNFPELYRIFMAVQFGYDQGGSTQLGREVLGTILSTLYPGRNSEATESLLTRLASISVSETILRDALRGIKLRESAASIASSAIAFSDGHGTPESLQTEIEKYSKQYDFFSSDSVEQDNPFITTDLEFLVNQQVSKTGLRWRLNSLNRNLGSLRKGDFGFVFARPETGKTTFLASELTFMAEQEGDAPIIWFNNEEEGNKVMLRIYQAVFGITFEELLKDVPKYRAAYLERTRDRIRLVDNANLTAREAEKIIGNMEPALVVFDQIDKLHGFSNDRTDLELASIYKWARGIAKTYCPVIGICQAGATGDGKKWLTMNDVDNSKTGKQAEADWILGIGKTYDSGLEALRYLHLSKNKLLGDSDHDTSMRHGKWEVKINPERARYEDF